MLLDHVELYDSNCTNACNQLRLYMSCTLFWCYSACRVSEDLSNLSNWVSNVRNACSYDISNIYCTYSLVMQHRVDYTRNITLMALS